MAEKNLLAGVLFQLSPYFRNDGPALDMLKGLLDAVSCDKYSYAAEFRHRTWLDESAKEIDPAVMEILRERNVANVLVDGPEQYMSKEQEAHNRRRNGSANQISSRCARQGGHYAACQDRDSA